MASPLLDNALVAHAAGLCVLPPRQDGTKAPEAFWRLYQERRPTEVQIRQWYTIAERTGIGYVCGLVSGGLELFEFEDAETFARYESLIADHDLTDVWSRVKDGYLERTPGGGVHILWRTPDPGANTKLASRPNGTNAVQVLVETRGRGGYTVAAPSHGSVHPSGGAYELVAGGVATIAEVNPDEREALFALARMLDEMPPRPAELRTLPGIRGDRPGDRLNAEIVWADLLPQYGWTFIRQCGEESYWRRPGKDLGVSATTNYMGSGVLKVFTTSTPLDAEKTYSPFAFYTVMEHNGDFRAAAQALAQEQRSNGNRAYGAAATRQTPCADPEAPPAPAFPIEVLPPPVRAYVEAAAESLSVPAEMVGVPMIGLAGALIGNRLHVVLKTSWREYPALFLAVVAPPGSAKTPALSLAQWPLDALQNEATREFRARLAEYEVATDALKRVRPQDRGPKPVRPEQRNYFSTNLTLEALVAMLDRAPGVAIIRDEILSWLTSMDQYRAGKGSDRQEYLSLWACRSIKVDRKGADPIYRRFPVVSVIGGIQPDLAGQLHHAAQMRDGFVERLLPIVPVVGPMPWTDETIDSEQYAEVLATYRALDELPPADRVENGGDGIYVGIGVRLSLEARQLYIQWHDENKVLIEEAQGLCAGFYSKLPSHLARLALILHALWNPADPRPMIAAERMADAIALTEFFRTHIGRFLALLNAAAPLRSAGVSPRILRVLQTSESELGNGWINRSHIMERLRLSAAELTAGLETLRSDGTIESRKLIGPTKPTEQWRLAHEESPFRYSEYSDYPGRWTFTSRRDPQTGLLSRRKSEYSECLNAPEDGEDERWGEEMVV